jgi:hypothetical protein
MVKVPIKRKQKQKIKQKVKVSQNVKVVIGDIRKRKQVRAKAGTKAGASNKPPIILNISNPQPYNNPYMMFFKEQLQNQQPIQANTLREHERLNEKEETKASKAGALHKLDQEPNDVARELRAKAAETRAAIQASKSQQQKSMAELRASLKPVSERKIFETPLRPRQKSLQERLMENIRQDVPLTPSVDETQANITANLQAQQEQLENVMAKRGGDDDEEAGAGAGADDGGEEETKTEVGAGALTNIPATPIGRYSEPKRKTAQIQRGRKPLSKEIVQARLEEEARLRRERIGMEAEDKKRRKGRKLLSQEEIDRRRKERELQKLERLFQETDTD